MVDGEDLYQDLTTISNLAKELEDVTRANIMDEDFMTIVYFSIIGVLRYANIVKIVMNDHVLGRANLINKFTAMEQQHKVVNDKPIEVHTAIQASNKRKRKRKKGTCFNCKKKKTLCQ